MESKTKKPITKKQWYESHNTHTLKEYAKSCGAEYVKASFENWIYTGEHVKVIDRKGWGTYSIAIQSNGNNNSSSDSEKIEIKFQFRPRRKLEFFMVPKRGFLGWIHRDMREVTMPDNAMSKTFKGIATHPSLLRSVLKHEGLSDEMLAFMKASVRLKMKDHKATLHWQEAYKKPDVEVIQERLLVLRRFVQALHEQNVIHEV